MLRLVVLVLLLSNAAYYAWTHRMLAAYGLAPAVQSEPHRVDQQIRPEALVILSQQEASLARQPNLSAAASGLSTTTECLQVGVFNEEQTVVLRDRLISVLPAGSWALDKSQEPARWLIYMGKYSAPGGVGKKQSELRAIGVSFEALDNAALEPGLSLGSFKTRADADIALASIAKKGVKTAKVVLSRPEQSGQRLTIPVVDSTLRTQLDQIKPLLAGKALKLCS